MKSLYTIIITTFFILNPVFVYNKAFSGEDYSHDAVLENMIIAEPLTTCCDNGHNKYLHREDLFDYIENPYLSNINNALESHILTSYALPYYGNITYYGNESPLEKYSTGVTRFTRKSMSIFAKEVENTLLFDDFSNILLNSMLGIITNNVLGLSIWSSTDVEYVSGFEASVKPFNNMRVSYTYMSENKLNTSTFQLRFGYNKNSNIALKNMYTFTEKDPVNTTTGVEWQFYF